MPYLEAWYINFWNVRSCPVFVFASESYYRWLLTRFILGTGIFCFDSTDDYAHSLCEGYTKKLLIFSWAYIIYELGRLHEMDWSISEYLDDTWNRMDALVILLLLFWMSSLVGIADSVNAQISIGLAVIPLVLVFLKFLSLQESLGSLVISLVKMGQDLLNFLALFIISMIGFDIAFYILFANSGFAINTGFINLFSSMLGGVDYTMFSSEVPEIHRVGILLYMAFVTFTGTCSSVRKRQLLHFFKPHSSSLCSN